mmetsp:Transcript_22245/g.54905  ORF Transcript_22245/g.54905 Transcript_22245/m.54905 type:complete len:204 (-) Transcript_22245:51-662(-)
MRYTAHVSPKSICSAVYVTGGADRDPPVWHGPSLNGVSSPLDGMVTCMSHILASVLLGLLVAATMNPPLALTYGTRVTSSSVVPDLDSMTTTSPGLTLPMSPCSASTGASQMDRVPVDTSVWHTFLAMYALLPTPVNSVVPLQSYTFWQNANTSSKFNFWKKLSRKPFCAAKSRLTSATATRAVSGRSAPPAVLLPCISPACG